jgi:Ni2+-binding GTPase involved in maturation of urease and hydrogenase
MTLSHLDHDAQIFVLYKVDIIEQLSFDSRKDNSEVRKIKAYSKKEEEAREGKI